jgi:hypothetical protein
MTEKKASNKKAHDPGTSSEDGGKSPARSDGSNKRPLDPTVLAAIITVIGGIITTLIVTYMNKPPAPTPTLDSPTAAVFTRTALPTFTVTEVLPTDAPTQTPIPPTDTLEPTPSFTPIPPVALGDDWPQGCISTLWSVYPAGVPVVDKGNGCWQEPVFTFTADNGILFMSNRREQRGPVDVYGLFALMPESGDVTFRVRLRKADGIDFIAGIFAGAEVANPGLLLSIPGDGNVSKLRVVQKDNLSAYTTIIGSALLDQGAGYSLTFTFSEPSVSAKVNPFVFVFDPIPLPSAEKWLFLGYKSGEGAYEVDIEVSGLTVK